MFKNYQGCKWYEKFAFSPLLTKKHATHKIAYLGLITALLTVCNAFLEIKFIDVQFSLTLCVSIIAGIFLGSGSGFLACMLGDGLGFMLSSWGYMYMPWVGLTSAVTALIAGLVFYFIPLKFKGSLFIKLALICLLSFALGTVLINSTCFYIYNDKMGFTASFNDYVSERFGGNTSYIAYVIYRIFFKGQIFNCLFNYALAFLITPMFLSANYFKKELS